MRRWPKRTFPMKRIKWRGETDVSIRSHSAKSILLKTRHIQSFYIQMSQPKSFCLRPIFYSHSVCSISFIDISSKDISFTDMSFTDISFTDISFTDISFTDCMKNIRPGWKELPWTNALAYLASFSLTK
jgi:hypothetical protein